MIYRPRMAATLAVPVYEANSELARQAHGSDTIEIPLLVKSAKLTRNSHKHPDTLSLTCDWRDCGIDPRFVRSATCDFYIDNADTFGRIVPSLDNCEFTGVCTSVSRTSRVDGGFEVAIEFEDYTSFFLAQTRYPEAGVPQFSSSLKDAWRLVCDNTGFFDISSGKIVSSVARLRERLVFRGGVDPDQAIGKDSVLPVMQRMGTIEAKSKSAWEVWQYCVAMLGLISFIDGDQCIVTTASENYSVDTDRHLVGNASLVWGENIAEMEERVASANNGRGVALTSFDCVTGSVIEAYYPAPGDPRIHIRRASAKTTGIRNVSTKPTRELGFAQTDQYDFFPYNYAQTIETLEAAAQRVYEEFSRQTMEGRLVTKEMSVDSPDGKNINLLKLRAGDPIRVEVMRGVREKLSSNSSYEDKFQYLTIERGYADQTAALLISNSAALDTLKSDFVVQTASISLSDTDFSVDIKYISYIDISGHAKPPVK